MSRESVYFIFCIEGLLLRLNSDMRSASCFLLWCNTIRTYQRRWLDSVSDSATAGGRRLQSLQEKNVWIF